ncbi:MAG: hypothetical protein HC877_22020 [Thioploca sp.]|nr:hypothetical protein [Thioploca sp.]
MLKRVHSSKTEVVEVGTSPQAHQQSQQHWYKLAWWSSNADYARRAYARRGL